MISTKTLYEFIDYIELTKITKLLVYISIKSAIIQFSLQTYTSKTFIQDWSSNEPHEWSFYEKEE